MKKPHKIWEDCPFDTPLNLTRGSVNTPRARRAAWLRSVNSGRAAKVPFGDAERQFFSWASERCAEVGPFKATHDRKRVGFRSYCEVVWELSRSLAHLKRSKWVDAIEEAWEDATEVVGLIHNTPMTRQ
jgi:hypothetical protein